MAHLTTSLFAAPLMVPVFRWFDANGNPLAGGKVETYEAGTSTPLNTYQNYNDAISGANWNANPVILDANGAAQIWVQARFYKIIVKDSGGTVLYSQDYVSTALGYPYPTVTEWILEEQAPTYIGATSFKFAGIDLTSRYHAGRRLFLDNVYATVRTSSFGTDTTVTVVCDGASGVVPPTLANVKYGLTGYVNSPYLDPRTFFTAIKSGNQSSFGSSTKVATWTMQVDANSEWDNANNRWVCRYPGNYQVQVSAEMADTGTNIALTLEIKKNGATVGQTANRSSATASQIWGYHAHYLGTLTNTDYIEVFVTGSANTTVQGTAGTRFSVVRVP